MKQHKFLISGGGTGRHIYPAISIADELSSRIKNIEIEFVGAKNRMEMKKVPENGYRITGLWISGIKRNFNLSNLLIPVKIIFSLIKSFFIIRQFNPSCVIGKGIMIDHATRVVIGERVLIGDNISLLHSVTIIAPKVEDLVVIEDNVLISAGASIIGNINIKKGAKVGAGSLVIENVSEGSTVVGVPSRQL